MLHFSSFLRTALSGLALLPLAALAQTPDTLTAVYTRVSGAKVSRLSVHQNGALLLGGEYNGGYAGGIPAEGAGTRLMWYPDKAAFRAGYINGTQWDDANVGVYSNALGYNVRALGDYSLAVGKDVVAANIGTVALGEFCSATGANSVALGYYASTRTSAGSPRQGTFVFADRSVIDDGNVFSDESFNAETNHAAHWRVINGFRIYTSTDRSSGVIIQSGGTLSGSSVNPSWYQPTAVISTSTGAYLSNGGAWTNASDRNKKHLFEPVSGEDVLRRLRQVPITRWSYKKETGDVRHLGPMAQDFRRAFGLGPDSISIGTVDADGVALAGVQALDARTRTQSAQLTALQAENQALRARLDALEQRTGGSTAGLPLAAGLLLAGAGLGVVLRRRTR